MRKNINNATSYVLYHANCMDGYAAAWSAWKALGNDVCYLPVYHHEPIPELADNSTVYILDFCYPMNVLTNVAKRLKKLVVLDHHLSAQKDFEAFINDFTLPENVEINFDLNHSGCLMAWQYFHPSLTPPELLLHVEDHDLWRHQLQNTEAICCALYLHLPTNFSTFEEIKMPILKREGAVLIRQKQINVTHLLKAQHKVTINSHIGLAVNAPAMFSSDLGHELAKQSGTYGLTYCWHGKKQRYDCALRSIGNFDVSSLAKVFGGGGHLNASGFIVDQATLISFNSID